MFPSRLLASVCLALYGIAASEAASPSDTPNVFYFRLNNYDSTESYSTFELRKWNTTLNLFDSPEDLIVSRLDISGDAGSTVEIFPSSNPLSLEGAMYFFSNTTALGITDAVSGTSNTAEYEDAIVWMSSGSCLGLSVAIPDSGMASLYALSSGAVAWDGVDSPDKCTGDEATVLIGAGSVNEHAGTLRDNAKVYNLTNPENCESAADHDDTSYSNMDAPIGPLDAHYHTRGAIYYVLYGQGGKFNDEAAPNDIAMPGELRFVNTGVYYGPEELTRDTTFVASIHEVDPSSLDPEGTAVEQHCAFACFEELSNDQVPSTCEFEA